MTTNSKIEYILRLARQLSPAERLKLIEQIAAAPSEDPGLSEEELDEQYRRGYERIPEDISEIEAMLPYLPAPTERWE